MIIRLRDARVVQFAGFFLVLLGNTVGAGDVSDSADWAADVLNRSNLSGGLVVYVGAGDATAWGKRAAALGADARCVVHGLYADPDAIEAARTPIRAAGLYGRVAVEPWTGSRLPYADDLVSLLVLDEPVEVVEAVDDASRVKRRSPSSAAPAGLSIAKREVLRVLAPDGVALVWEKGQWHRLVKTRPETIDDWSHALYDATNNAVSRDRVVGPPRRLQWIARPLNARHHEHLAVSVVVSAGGRIFYIIDEGPTASLFLPPQWSLIARDAFNGVVLWKRSIPQWEDHLRPFRSGPPHISRTLVATAERVYVTLGLRTPVSVLNPATGKTFREYPQTKGTEEILYHDGILYLAVRQADNRAPRQTEAGRETKAAHRKGVGRHRNERRQAHQTDAAPNGPRGLMAVDAKTGSTLWQLDGVGALPMSLAVGGNRVVYMTNEAVVCCDARTGQRLWRSPRDVPRQRPGWSAPTVVLQDGVVLVADRWPKFKDRIDPVTGKPIANWLAQEGWTGDLIAYDASSGKVLWKALCAETYHAPPDVFVIDGLVWVGQSRSRTGPDFVAARDLHTGEIKRRLDTHKAWETTMPHHRCYRNRATARYLITGRTGVEFIDVATGKACRHHWTRGTCQFGTLPANGLLYVPPHSCACYIDAKLTGFLAMAPAATLPSRPIAGAATDESGRLIRGPAFGHLADQRPTHSAHPGQPATLNSRPSNADSPMSPLDSQRSRTDWPTHRHDALRSGCAPQSVPADLGRLWQRRLDARPTAPVVAEGRVFVATADTHTVHALDATTGRPVWSFTSGGRIDSPPSVT
ncbi:MAG: PQQ-binding-like beta-propeller repeat protein, partial [Planctomycetes bacterium]|nr:PQQ-binding-like beta-propeller repeat protein [Planctomycetota bacterium]